MHSRPSILGFHSISSYSDVKKVVEQAHTQKHLLKIDCPNGNVTETNELFISLKNF